MGGTTLVRGSEMRTAIQDDFTTTYRTGLGHLVAFFRAKGIGADEALDLANETFTRTLVHLKRHGRTQADLGPLTRTIARNLLVERIRRAGPAIVSLSDGTDIDVADDAADPEDVALASERRDEVRAALLSLAPRHRRVVELWMQGRSPAEIARELGIKRNAADAILHRARRNLAAKLGPRTAWGVVALPFTRLRANVRQTLRTLASWSPGSVDAAPLGVTLASAGLVAILSVTSSSPAPAVERPAAPRTPVVDASQRADVGETGVASIEGAASDEVTADVSTVDAPPYRISSRDIDVGDASPDTGGEFGITYDPESGGRGPLDAFLEPAIRELSEVNP